MSVVNTVLRELAERELAERELVGRNADTAPNVLPLASATPPPRRIPLGVAVAVPLLVVVILLWRFGVFAASQPASATAEPTQASNAVEPTVHTVITNTSVDSTPVFVADASAAPAITLPVAAENNTALVQADAGGVAAASIGWEEVDFAALGATEEPVAEDELASVAAKPVAAPAEPVRFERTAAAESQSAMLARLRQQAQQAIGTGNWQEANEAIHAGMAVAPNDPELALLHVESEALRDPSVAEQTATAVLNELPSAWPVRQWLGVRWLQMQQAKRAYSVLTIMAPALATAPDYHAVLALAAQQSGEHAAAVAAYRQLIALQPSHGRHQSGLAISLEALGDNAGARSAWQQALRDPQLPAPLVHYGQNRLQQLPSTTSSAQASP